MDREDEDDEADDEELTGVDLEALVQAERERIKHLKGDVESG